MSWFEHGKSRIYYEEHGAGDPVLILPGFAVSVEDLSALSSALASDYRVIVADLPGSGSSGPQPRAYTSNFYLDDARSMVELLRHLESGPTHLIGFSDGGEVALLMAAITPEIARSVVVWGVSGTFSQAQVPLLDIMYDVVDSPIEPMQGFSDYLKAVYGEANARATTRSWVDALRAIAGGGGDISLSRANDITCPVLIIVPEHDFLPLELVNELASRIRAVELVEASDAGHAVHNERPEWFNRVVRDWLARH